MSKIIEEHIKLYPYRSGYTLYIHFEKNDFYKAIDILRSKKSSKYGKYRDGLFPCIELDARKGEVARFMNTFHIYIHSLQDYAQPVSDFSNARCRQSTPYYLRLVKGKLKIRSNSIFKTVDDIKVNEWYFGELISTGTIHLGHVIEIGELIKIRRFKTACGMTKKLKYLNLFKEYYYSRHGHLSPTCGRCDPSTESWRIYQNHIIKYYLKD